VPRLLSLRNERFAEAANDELRERLVDRAVVLQRRQAVRGERILNARPDGGRDDDMAVTQQTRCRRERSVTLWTGRAKRITAPRIDERCRMFVDIENDELLRVAEVFEPAVL
jgi:hypothetical protein